MTLPIRLVAVTATMYDVSRKAPINDRVEPSRTALFLGFVVIVYEAGFENTVVKSNVIVPVPVRVTGLDVAPIMVGRYWGTYIVVLST
jgi:hypothetical protein